MQTDYPIMAFLTSAESDEHILETAHNIAVKQEAPLHAVALQTENTNPHEIAFNLERLYKLSKKFGAELTVVYSYDISQRNLKENISHIVADISELSKENFKKLKKLFPLSCLTIVNKDELYTLPLKSIYSFTSK